MLFSEDILDVSFENTGRSPLHLRELPPKYTETTTLAVNQLHGTTVDLSAPLEPFKNTTGRLPTTTNNRLSTFDEEDVQKFIETQASRLRNTSQQLTCTTCTTSDYNAHSTRSSLQTSHRTSSERQVKQEDSTDKDSSANHDQENATDGEGHSTRTNHRFNSEISVLAILKEQSSPQ